MISDVTHFSTSELVQLALAEDDRERFFDYLGTLQLRGDRAVLEAAQKLCTSEISEERSLGAQIFGQLGVPERTFPEDSLIMLLKMLEQEVDPLVLSDVGIALGHLSDPRVVIPLVPLKNHPSAEVRFGVACGLLGQEDELAIAVLIELSSDPDREVRNWATFGLGSMIDTDTPAIREALWQRILQEDEDREVGEEARDNIAEIHGEALVGLARRKDERVIEPLLKALSRDRVGCLPIEAAEEMGDRRLYPALMELQEWWERNDDLLARAIENCR